VDAINADGSSVLSGDRNITNKVPVGNRFVYLTSTDAIGWTKEIHSEKGHLAFGDGRVDTFSNGSVGAANRISDATTNRLAMP